MDRIENESSGLFCPGTADVFVRGKAFQDLETTGEIVSGDEVDQVGSELVVAVIVIAVDGRLFDRAVHPLDLPIGPWVMGDMEFALMDKVVLRGARLQAADMSGAILDAAVLTRADLRMVNLRGAGFRDARLDEADLRGARLGGAFLIGASLRGADLRGAYVRLARFDGADLSGANLDEVV